MFKEGEKVRLSGLSMNAHESLEGCVFLSCDSYSYGKRWRFNDAPMKPQFIANERLVAVT